MRVAGEYIAQGLQKTGATNIVAAIILDFRGYDTLGEATILFTAVMGVLAVIRRVGRINEK
jgi:multisubunit Na+/H+ antiporter MnhB subunit